MKKIVIMSMLVVFILASTAIPLSAISVDKTNATKVIGMWGIGTDTEPSGTIKGYYFPNHGIFAGKVFFNGNGYYMGLQLNNGVFAGYIKYNGNNVPINGEYSVTNGILTGIWHCNGNNGWLIAQI